MIEADAVAIGDEHEQQVEQQLVGAERGEESFAQEAMGDEAEALPVDAAYSCRHDRCSLDPNLCSVCHVRSLLASSRRASTLAAVAARCSPLHLLARLGLISSRLMGGALNGATTTS
jgi:hypothetical protein